MWERHQITPEQAEEALADEQCVVFEPDYASVSGQSIRVIGAAASIGQVLTVIVVADGAGKVWGASAWRSNRRDRAYYEAEWKEESHDQDS